MIIIKITVVVGAATVSTTMTITTMVPLGNTNKNNYHHILGFL